jgi:hypothetical protein
MPQLVALALIGAGLYAGLRWVVRAANEGAARVNRTGQEGRGPEAAAALPEKDLGALVLDPASGVYRPARRN